MIRTQTAAPAELALAALYWDPATGLSLQQHTQQWLAAHRAFARAVLWGTTDPDLSGFEPPHVRVPGTPDDVVARRNHPAGELTREAVLEADPAAYEAEPFRGFAHTDFGFRDWHLVSHRLSAADIYTRALQAREAHGIDWTLAVEAAGQSTHAHALISFRHARTQVGVLNALNIAPDTELKLAPVHGSFDAAREYLAAQATATFEFGSSPRRAIMVDGNRVSFRNNVNALFAVSEGENTAVADSSNSGAARRNALRGWIRDKLRRGGEPSRQQEAASTQEALDAARRVAPNYSNRIFIADYAQVLPGSHWLEPPSTWFGEEVVILRNIPANLVAAQLRAAWVQAVPWVYYTVNHTPPAAFVRSSRLESLESESTDADSVVSE